MVALSPNALKILSVAALAVGLSFVATPTRAAAQPGHALEWPQFQGGPAHRGALEDGPAPPYRVRWSLPAPDGGSLSGAVLVDGVAIALGREALYGVDVTSGEVLWRLDRSGGPIAIPAVGEERSDPVLVFTEAPGEEGGELVGVTLEDRSERWRTPLGAASRSGVTIEGASAYVGDQDGTVYAVSLDDGEVRWTAEVEGRADMPIAVADGHVYVVSRDGDEPKVQITAFDQRSGEPDPRWEGAVSLGIGTTAVSRPAVGDGLVVVGTADRLVRSLNAADGVQEWSTLLLSLLSPVSSPAIRSGDVFVVDLGGGLYRIDASSGERVWGFQLNELTFRSSPVVSGDTVLVGLNDGRLAAVDAGSGRLIWQSRATPGLIGTIALSEDAIVAVKGGREAGLIAFEPDPEGRLIDVSSPTELELGRTLATMGLAALVVFAAAFLPGALARRRFGDALAGEEDERNVGFDDGAGAGDVGATGGGDGQDGEVGT